MMDRCPVPGCIRMKRPKAIVCDTCSQSMTNAEWFLIRGITHSLKFCPEREEHQHLQEQLRGYLSAFGRRHFEKEDCNA